MLKLSGWVGSPGQGPGNLRDDVLLVQALLSMVPPAMGGPDTPL